MAAAAVSASSPPPASNHEKPVIVRIKRKASQARLDTLWLEINERPQKRPLLDFARLSIAESEAKVQEELRTKKLLVQHVETISHSKATKEVLRSLMADSVGSEDGRMKNGERKSKQYKNQDKVLSVSRKKHEELVRNARFEQIWKSRRGSKGEDDYSLREFCHLYDIVRVDTEDDNSGKVQEADDVSAEENAILCNYLPLMREFLPTAAEEIESEMKAYFFKEDNYVYDLYTVEDNMQVCEEGASNDYPLVHVKVDEDDDWYDGPEPGEYESDDSNAEDNPRNDYPDESTEDDDVDSNEDHADDEGSSEDGNEYHSDSEYELEIVGNEESDGEDMHA